MCHNIEKVYQLAMLTFARRCSPSEPGFKVKVDRLLAQVNKLTGLELGLDKCQTLVSDRKSISLKPNSNRPQHKAPVTYIPITENKHFSMGIFVIREGQKIPIHDHPHMFGIIKCLEGSLKVSSYTKTESSAVSLPADLLESDSPQQMERLRMGQIFPTEKQVIAVTSDSNCCLLEPLMFNIHQIESVGGGAAFLDILAPPYNIRPRFDNEDQEVRDCHYYREFVDPSGSHTWLMQCEPPAFFFSNTEVYQGQDIRPHLLKPESEL